MGGGVAAMNWNPLSWFPFTQPGRQTLVYFVFAWAGPVLTAITVWAMVTALANGLQATFSNLAYLVGGCLLIIVTGLAMFVSIRAVRLGKDGFSAEGGNEGNNDNAPL